MPSLEGGTGMSSRAVPLLAARPRVRVSPSSPFPPDPQLRAGPRCKGWMNECPDATTGRAGRGDWCWEVFCGEAFLPPRAAERGERSAEAASGEGRAAETRRPPRPPPPPSADAPSLLPPPRRWFRPRLKGSDRLGREQTPNGGRAGGR